MPGNSRCVRVNHSASVKIFRSFTRVTGSSDEARGEREGREIVGNHGTCD